MLEGTALFTVIKPPDLFLFRGDILPTPFLIHPSLYLMNHFWAARYFVSTSFCGIFIWSRSFVGVSEKGFYEGKTFAVL